MDFVTFMLLNWREKVRVLRVIDRNCVVNAWFNNLWPDFPSLEIL